MPAFRILDQSPVYLDLQGNLAAGGTLHFYEAGSTTDKDVYGDQALTVNNGSTIAIGSDGRPVDDVWGSGNYRVRLYAADGTLVSDDDDVEIPGGTGTAIPTLDAGKFLTNDGSVPQWADVLAVPDPTGQSGKVLGSDGSSPIWQALATPSSFAPVITSGSIKLGTIMLQWGSDTVSASGAFTANKAFTFPTSFSTLYHASVEYSGSSGIASNGGIPVMSCGNRSVSGASAFADMNSFGNIINPIPFTWFAVGSVPA